MSGVSSAELILLLLIGLVVLGPKRLPEIARKVGGWVAQARRMTRVMRRQLEEELELDQTPSINPTGTAAQAAATTAPDPADPAYDADEPVAQHIPNDDDTYSPLHEEGDEEPGDPADDKVERERDA